MSLKQIPLLILILLLIAAPIRVRAEEASAPELLEERKPGEAKNDKEQAKEGESADAQISNTEGEQPPAEQEDPEKAERRSGIAKLIKKLTDANGKQVPIGVLTPIDYTTMNFAELCQETILNAISRYGTFDLQTVNYTPTALTLEEFRKVVVTYDIDIVVLAVLKPTNFDVFLYDRRVPYQIYAHSEVLPESVQYQVTKQVVEEYTKVIVRRALYAYMQDQFFELPREEARPFLSAEIPRWIASNRNFHLMNREILSNTYVSAAVGAGLASGNGRLWTSNIASVQAGYRVAKNYFIEGNLDLFSCNAVGLSIKKMFAEKDALFKFTLGGGIAYLSNAHTLNWDQALTQQPGGMYLTPSASFIFPIVEVSVKVEAKIFLSPDFKKAVVALMPGVFFMF